MEVATLQSKAKTEPALALCTQSCQAITCVPSSSHGGAHWRSYVPPHSQKLDRTLSSSSSLSMAYMLQNWRGRTKATLKSASEMGSRPKSAVCCCLARQRREICDATLQWLSKNGSTDRLPGPPAGLQAAAGQLPAEGARLVPGRPRQPAPYPPTKSTPSPHRLRQETREGTDEAPRALDTAYSHLLPRGRYPPPVFHRPPFRNVPTANPGGSR